MKTFNAEIISQGEEVITGQIVDTNAAWLSERLTRLGFQITRHITVGDRLDDLITTFVEVTKRADVCICTGGLGPTSDDLTSQAVATAFNRPLHEDKIALQQIQQYFTQRQKTMAVINRKQALMPEGARRLDNHWGTAPGFVLRENDCQLFCVPGVPYEMRQLFDHQIESLLIVDYEQQASQLVTIRTVNLGESDIQQRIQHIGLPESVTLSYRADVWENQTKLLFPPDYPQQLMDDLVNQYVNAIGHPVFSIDGLQHAQGGSLVDVVGRLLAEQDTTVSFVETVSAGELAARCADIWLDNAEIIVRTDQLLKRYGIRNEDLYSIDRLKQTAVRIARLLCENNGSDYAVVQLRVNRDGFDKPEEQDDSVIQTVTAAVDCSGRFVNVEDKIAGSMRRRQIRAAVIALDLLRKLLLNSGTEN